MLRRMRPGRLLSVLTCLGGRNSRYLTASAHASALGASNSISKGPVFSEGCRGKSELSKAEMVLNAKNILSQAQAVCFDVDSTVISEEGIDILAEFMGVGEAVADLTRGAMEGGMKFEEALDERLNLIKPGIRDIQNCLEAHPFELTPGVQALVQTLHDRDVKVFLISGGFRNMIAPVADQLGIPSHRIYANTILFDEEGKYVGFDPEEYTSRDGGKAVVIQRIKADLGYDPIVMIGDGVTDLQSRPHSDAFIGFGGVVEREVVKEEADWFVKDFSEILEELKR